MAQQRRTVPIRNTVPIRDQRSEPISWPSPQEPVSRPLPTEELYQSSIEAAQNSLHTAQQRVFRAATSLIRSVRRFADERPLHFVGIIAGASLLAGVALRIWRSKRYA
jgi:hypothetical protein